MADDYRYTTNARGFVVIEFQDRYGVECSLQQSSLATEDAIWFGPSDPNPKILHGDAKRLGIATDADCGWVPYPLPGEVQCTTRMHPARRAQGGGVMDWLLIIGLILLLLILLPLST